MRVLTILAATAIILGSGAVLAQSTQPATNPAFQVPSKNSPDLAWWRDSMKIHDQRIQWWRDARFGMFIHWGVYSELAGEWQGKPVEGYAEHIMRKCKIPLETYKKEVVAKFNPVNFNADEWAKLAKEAGVGYMVITSKHHDGFAMFDSDVSDYNVVKATPWHHDPMKDLKAATAKQGIRFGFYHSQAWDWSDPNATGNDWDWDRPGGDKGLHGGRNWWDAEPDQVDIVRKYVDGKAIPQVQELITKYQPDLIWFDTPSKMPPSENLRVLKAAREAGPNVVINSRCVANLGDYLSTADRPAEFAPHEGDWEGIPTTNESYGYHKSDRSHKPVSHFIQIIAKAAARGGNLMLNVGPRGDGTLDPADVAILQGIGKWMKVNADSIRGTIRTPLIVQAWGESTRKANTLYLHVFNWPSDGKLVVGGLRSNVQNAYLLSDSTKAPLTTQRLKDQRDLLITVPAEAPDPVDAVVVVECDGNVDCDSNRLLSVTQANVLRSFDGKLQGSTLRFAPGKKENAFVEQWSRSDEAVSWAVRASEQATFHVVATYDAPDSSDGGTYAVKIASKTLNGTVKKGVEQSDALGTVRLSPLDGDTVIRVEPVKIAGDELMRLRTVTLSKVANETAANR